MRKLVTLALLTLALAGSVAAVMAITMGEASARVRIRSTGSE